MDLLFNYNKYRGDRYYREEDTLGDYIIKEIIGEGRYGIAYLAQDKDNHYVVKQLKKKMLNKDKHIISYEEKALKSLDYPYFPRFISHFYDKDREGYIMEYMEGEVLEDLIKRDGYQFYQDEIIRICEQLVGLIEILRSHNIVHGDIRLPNIIRKPNNDLALIDFGLAIIKDHKYDISRIDYWYLGDLMLRLYYTTYNVVSKKERPWYQELDLTPAEKIFLKRLMCIEKPFNNIHEVRQQLNIIKYSI